jgi:predicted Zn-dependent peptidase
MSHRAHASTRALWALAILAAGSARASSQQVPTQQALPSTTQMVLKGKAPVSKEVLKVKLPKPSDAPLSNGLRVMVLEDHRLPQVSFQLVIPGAGGYYDPDDRPGLAGFVAAMMREGTATRTSEQISEALETMGASLSFGAGASSTSAQVFGSALTKNLPALFDIASDVLLHPAFAAAEWDRYRARTKPNYTQLRTNPNFLANERFNEAVFGSHPAGRLVSNATVIDAVAPAMLTDFHKAHYVPDHAVIAFAGDITLAQARALVEKGLGAWHQAGASAPQVSDPAPIGPAKIYLINRPGSVQTTLWVGTQALKRTSPDYTSLTVANRVLGGVMGRLFRHLREEKGYTYGVGSGISASPYVGSWIATTSVRTEVTEPALRDLLAEIAAMRDSLVPAQELEDSKRALVASFALSLESPQQMLSYYVDSWTYGLPANYWDTYPSQISAVTATQAQTVARKYWDASRLQIVAVGDASKIRDLLSKLGAVIMLDAEGKPIS